MKRRIVVIVIVVALALMTVGGVVLAKDNSGGGLTDTVASSQSARQYVDDGEDASNGGETENLERPRTEEEEEDEDGDRDGDEDTIEIEDEDAVREQETINLRGIIQELNPDSIVVDGKTILIGEDTKVKGNLAVGATVRVKAISEDGSLLALKIKVKRGGTPPTPPPPPTPTPPPAPTPTPIPPPEPTPTPSPTPTFNAAQFFANNCARCHGADRLGGVIGVPLTPTSLSGFTVAQLATFIQSHRGVTSAEANAVADFLKNTPP